VHVVDHTAIRFLWECGFFGKGALSRSEPEWLERERRRRGLLDAAPSQTSAEVTRKRREERRDVKRERARLEREALEAQLREEGKLPVVEVEANVEEEEEESKEVEEKVVGLLNSDESPEELAETTTGMKVEDRPNSTLFENSKQGIRSTTSTEDPVTTELINQEHLQLTPSETFFLAYGLGVLDVIEPTSNIRLSSSELLALFRRTSVFPPLSDIAPFRPDDAFVLNYVVYHHFRSLGWVVRPGIKFSVDYLLYNRGPVFSHAEFAVLILPSYSHEYWSATPDRKTEVSKKEKKPWWWIHCANRVQSQVRKSLVLVYVEIPPPLSELDGASEDIGALLRSYSVREFVLKRWSANRNRD